MGGQARRNSQATIAHGVSPVAIHGSAQAFNSAWNFVYNNHPCIPKGMIRKGITVAGLDGVALKAWNSLPKAKQNGQGLAAKLRGNFCIDD